MIHLYESHLGRYYVAEEYHEEFLEICETCLDSDWYVGKFETMEEVALTMYKDNATDEHIAEVTGLKVNEVLRK